VNHHPHPRFPPTPPPSLASTDSCPSLGTPAGGGEAAVEPCALGPAPGEAAAVATFCAAYTGAVNSLSAALDAGASDTALKAGAEACRALVADLAARRRAALAQGAVSAVGTGAFLPPGMKLMAWMGGSRPSDALACLRAKLAALGEAALAPEAGAGLVALQAGVAGQQASIAAAWTGLSERLARTVAVAQFVRATLGGWDGGEQQQQRHQPVGGGEGGSGGGGEQQQQRHQPVGGGEGGSGGGGEQQQQRHQPPPRRPPTPTSGGGLPPLHPHPPASSVPARRPAAGRGSPAVAGIVADMASLLAHAEDLRQLVTDRVCGSASDGGLGLPPRAVALYWVGVGDLVRLDDHSFTICGGGGGLHVRRGAEGGGR